MADFSSLKQTIQSYIKQNGNEEITGNILQDVLLAMVSTMGESAINALASALQDEITARQNQDGILQGNINAEATARQNQDATLQGNINAEATARQQADTALGGRIDGLQTVINGINTKLAEGYIYAGIATPSTNPGTPSGKVFYIAVSSGTYTNFSNLTVAQGINILKYNGSSWSKDVVYAIDARPKKNSQNPVTSGGVFDNIGALDVSELNATENPHTLAQYTDLSAALAAIPTDYQKGGMSIKFVQSSDNKYVQYRLTANSFTTDVRMWQEINSDRYVKNLTDIYDDEDIYGYITDEEQKVFAVIYKDGSIRKLVLTEEEVKVGELLGMVSSESVLSDEDVLKYFTDENDICFGFIKKDGTVFFNRIGTNHIDNKTINLLSQEAVYNDDNVLKYLTDEQGTCFGYIATDGTVVIYKAKILNYDNEDAVSGKQFAAIVALLANGIDNVEVSNNPKFMSTLHNLFGNKVEINSDNNNNLNLRPCISIIDDDTVDNQIPISKGSTSVVANQGGYFSLLLPFMLSLGNKHNKNLCPGLACEGHRVGLTSFKQGNDDYTELNENGRAVKWLHNNMGWNVFNHSMTAQLMLSTYYVDGINSELAQRIVNENDYWDVPYSFWNCIVLDRLTGKWYELNNQSKYTWVERTPTKKYAMPFYQDYITKDWYFNRDFDFDYSWGEWFKRADKLGLPYEKVIVHNGNTSSVYMASAGRKYADWSIRTTGTHNYPPIPATVNRISDGSGDNNVRNVSYEERLMSEIDYCYEHNTWMMFMTHFNDQKYHRNYYLSSLTYPDGDPNYPDEWIVPLKHDEIVDIIGDNVHDYINHPPSRLNINSWSEWHPAPGTQLMSLYNVIDYAITKGIEFVSPMEGWNTHGNVLNLGVDRNGQVYSFDSAANVVPYTDDEKSYLTIGADMSIRYYNSKNV